MVGKAAARHRFPQPRPTPGLERQDLALLGVELLLREDAHIKQVLELLEGLDLLVEARLCNGRLRRAGSAAGGVCAPYTDSPAAAGLLRGLIERG